MACGTPPVEWRDDRTVTVRTGDITLTAAGDTIADSLAALERTLIAPSPACPGSLRVARARAMLVAVWWSPRADSSAHLVAARSMNGGGTWSAVSPVDSLDRSVVGCRRFPASVAIDSATGYVHVAYGLVAPEGTGIFFSHSMDSAATFHAPVPILYGDHPGRASVASSGDVVAVAYEDPNGTTMRIGLALSRSTGHIFEDRLLPVSDDNGAATQPLVAVTGRRIAIAWREELPGGSGSVLRIRTGILH
jgi:hypothetical protein